MRTKVARFGKFFTAKFALKRLFSRVSAHVNFKSARPHETLAALVALERALTCMAPKVVTQVTMRSKRPITTFECTHERLLPIMNSLVSLKITFLCESFLTAREVAFERLFTCVGALVDFEAPCSRVALPTDVTDKWFVAGVNQLVSFQVALRNELFATIF